VVQQRLLGLTIPLASILINKAGQCTSSGVPATTAAGLTLQGVKGAQGSAVELQCVLVFVLRQGR